VVNKTEQRSKPLCHWQIIVYLLDFHLAVGLRALGSHTQSRLASSIRHGRRADICCHRRTPQTTLHCDNAARGHLEVTESRFIGCSAREAPCLFPEWCARRRTLAGSTIPATKAPASLPRLEFLHSEPWDGARSKPKNLFYPVPAGAPPSVWVSGARAGTRGPFEQPARRATHFSPRPACRQAGGSRGNRSLAPAS
jgi:hypothetical protein